MSQQNLAEQMLFRIAVGGLKVLPDRWAINVCRTLAYLVGPVCGFRKQTVREQMAAVYPDRDAKNLDALVESVYDHLGRSVAETFCVSENALLDSVTVNPDWGSLDKAVAGNRGAIIVTGHLGNFELGGRVLAQRYSLLDVIKPMRNALFGEYLQKERLRHGIATVPMMESGKAVMRHLRGGGVVTLLLDQDAGKDGVKIDFLGRPASAWTGAARIALRTGCPLIPVAVVRDRDGGHQLHIGQEISTADLGPVGQEITVLTERCSQALEHHIYQHPAQWFWVHRRWKGAHEAQTD